MITLQQRISRAVQPISRPLTLPAPVGGWNTRDELDAMEPLDAVVLDNFYPDTTGIMARTGSESYATGMGAVAVETLAEFRAGGTVKFLAACNGSIFDISSGGAVGAALGSGFASNRWQTTNFLSHLFLANGSDTMQTFDGATLAASGFTGVTLSTLIGCYQYQQRLFFWQAGSVGFWFASLNSITGALSFYDLSPFCPRGANLTAITTITHDGGNGVLDIIAFLMSTGDMLLYYGNDPGNASAWQLVGRYRVSPPVNIRAVCSYGADSFVTTYDDYMQIQQTLVALKVGELPPRSKASGAVATAITQNGTAFGWQALFYPKGRRLIFNVPNLDGTFDQHICNTTLPSKPWCRFKGLNARCWGLYGDNLYFGGDAGVVYLADSGFEDLGGPITATGQQAWNKERSAYRKRMTVVRPIVQSTQGTYDFAVGFDYQPLDIPVPVALGGPALTDDAGADITDDSGESITVGVAGIDTAWQAAGGTGTAFSFGMTILSSGQNSWLRTDFRLEQGNAL